MNIWLVDPFDSLPGESSQYRRYSFLAEMLAKKGHKVTWWSSNFCHPTKRFRTPGQATIEVNDNLRVVLLKTPGYGRNISLGRFWNHYVYARALKAEGTRCTEAPDVIFANSTPLEGASAALALAKRFGAKCIVDVQDVWPEAFEVAFLAWLRPAVRILLSPLKRLADGIYDRADGITGVSHTYLRRALSASKDMTKPAMMLPLGVDIDLYGDYLSKPPSDMPHIKHDKSEFWAIYIGTIGKSYDIKTILRAAYRLSHQHPNIKLLIAGDGPDFARMRNHAQKKGLANVTFTGLLSYHQLTHLLTQCDVGINAIVAASRTSLPNKPFHYMAAALPIINSVKGELEELIKDEQVGLQYAAGSAESLAEAILTLHDNPQGRLLMGQRARKLAEERFDMNKEYPKLVGFLESFASKVPSR
ncbi:MAG: glycosyltransferase family 4 protein [Chloroflexi bacterium]|nr:glycosyltransferase family 4 protein [Chloroflexota bacterium]